MVQQLRVLVAEDEPLIRALVTMAFEAEGYDVDTAADGAEALEKACRQPPQAIVLDLMMPGVSGCDFRKWWRAEATCRPMPVIPVTAGGQEVHADELGMHGSWAKAVDLDRLTASLTKRLA